MKTLEHVSQGKISEERLIHFRASEPKIRKLPNVFITS